MCRIAFVHKLLGCNFVLHCLQTSIIFACNLCFRHAVITLTVILITCVLWVCLIACVLVSLLCLICFDFLLSCFALLFRCVFFVNCVVFRIRSTRLLWRSYLDQITVRCWDIVHGSRFCSWTCVSLVTVFCIVCKLAFVSLVIRCIVIFVLFWFLVIVFCIVLLLCVFLQLSCVSRQECTDCSSVTVQIPPALDPFTFKLF